MNYESINAEDVKSIESIQRRIDSTVEVLTSDLKYLVELLQEYKDSTKEMTIATLGETDILLKYSKGHNDNAYNLPGVFATTVSNYDLAEMRGDNEKLKDLQAKHKRADGNRSSAYSMISGTYNEIRTRLNLLATDNQSISAKLENLKDSLDD